MTISGQVQRSRSLNHHGSRFKFARRPPRRHDTVNALIAPTVMTDSDLEAGAGSPCSAVNQAMSGGEQVARPHELSRAGGSLTLTILFELKQFRRCRRGMPLQVKQIPRAKQSREGRPPGGQGRTCRGQGQRRDLIRHMSRRMVSWRNRRRPHSHLTTVKGDVLKVGCIRDARPGRRQDSQHAPQTHDLSPPCHSPGERRGAAEI